jgi:hypothetical protein
MLLNDLVRGLEIFRLHFNDKGNGYHLSAEDDELHVGKTDIPLSQECVEELRGYGWFQGESEEEVYDPKEPWMCYV